MCGLALRFLSALVGWLPAPGVCRGAFAGFTRLLWRLLGFFARISGTAAEFGDGDVQFAAGEIDADDDGFDDVADADGGAGALAADLPGFFVYVPPVIHEVFVADEAINEVSLELDEDAEVGDPGDDAEEFLADLPGQKFQDLHLTEFALGIIGAALGEAEVAAKFDQIV